MSKNHIRNPLKWHGDLLPDRFTVHGGLAIRTCKTAKSAVQ